MISCNRIVLAFVLAAIFSRVDAATLTITINGPNSGAVSVIGPGGNVCNPQGGGTCTFNYPAGTALRLTANAPSTPGVFNGGTGDAASCATSTCSIVLNSDSSITATFNQSFADKKSIQVVLAGAGKGQVDIDNSKCQNHELGFVECTSFYATGSEVTMDGRSVTGNIFDAFSGGTNQAVVCGSNPRCVFTLNTNSVVTASFAPLSSLAVQPGTATIDVGQTRTFTATGTFSNAATRTLFGSGTWQSKPSMTTARFSLAVAVSNDRLYAIGGANGVCSSSPCPFAPQTIVEMFTPAASPSGPFETWTTVSPMLTGREGLAAAAANGKIYALGGHAPGGAATASMEAYDPVANSWLAVAPMPTPRAALAAAVINNVIYAVGGGDVSSPLQTVEAYDPATNTWSTKAPMSAGRTGHAAVAVNGKLYVMGGGSNPGAVEQYDPATDTWTAKSAMPTTRSAPGATVLNGLIYVVGGQSGSPVGTVDVYNPSTDTWVTLAPSMPTARGLFGLVALDGRLFAVGGLTTSTNVTSALEVFQVPEVTWWSSDTAVATMNQTNGMATAVGAGAATISARSVGIDSGAQSATLLVNDTNVQPPTGLTASAGGGNTVTFTWVAPVFGAQPTGYVLEGGFAPGQVLASIPTGSTATTITLTLPNGSFYIRLHSVVGTQKSAASNEIRVIVGPVPRPSAPAGLLGAANGSNIVLTWRNTSAGGPPTGIVLDVTGPIVGSLPLPLSDTFTFTGVPPGTYTVVVRAVNSSGASSPSNSVTLTFPGTCQVPDVPADFVVTKSGNTINVSWSPPASGAAPSAYALLVTGAFTGEFTFASPGVSAVAPPGTFNFSLAAIAPCGRSASTPVQTVTIP